MMKRSILSLISGLLTIFLSVGCQHSTESMGDLDFQKMEVHYSKVGGWIHPTKLDIYGNGLVRAFLYDHSSLTLSDSASTVLTKKEQNEIAELFGRFSIYDRHYEPDDWVTDQNTHIIVLIYDSIPDTVSVYMPDKADIPLSLTRVILEMESLWANMLDAS